MNSNSITISVASSTYLEAILALFVDTINTVCTKDYSPEQRAVWTAGAKNNKRWQQKLERKYFLVARMEEMLVGFASLGNNYLDFLCVHKDYLGRGIAKQLYDELLHKATETNVEILASDVSITARPFFEKMGFVVIRKLDNPTQGVNLTNFRMEKRLKK